MKIMLRYLMITFGLLSLVISQNTHTVEAGSYYYSPNSLTINAGDTVVWENNAGFHDVEFVSGPETPSLGACTGPCTIGELVLNVPGTYSYICSIGSHEQQGMVGTLTVEPVVSTTASVQIVHNSASPTVDVYVDGALAVPGFEYRTATGVLELPLEFTVGIAPTGGEVIAEFPFTLEEGGEYVVVATGLLGNEDTPFGLAAAGTTFGASEGNVGLNVYHGSTDAPAVDILADGGVLVPNLSYGEFSGYVEVPASDYTIGIAPTGGESIADFVAPLSGLGGGSAVVFASGFLSGDDPAFGVFAALEDGTVLGLESSVSDCDACMDFCVDYVVENYGYTEEEATEWCLSTPDNSFGCADSCNSLPTTASVQIVHNSASPTVDVYVDGALAVPGFEYRTATGVLELPLEFTVGIAPTGGEVIAEFPFTLEEGGEYVVVATGLLGNEDTPFGLAAAGTTFGASEGNVGLNVYHGSTDAPAVDILADGGVLVPNLSYGEFSGYVEVPASDYTIGIAPTGGESIADFVAPLSGLGGGSAVVFASGFLSGDDPAFGVFAALEDGTVLGLESGSLSVIEFAEDFKLNPTYPNPFNPNTTISFEVNQYSDIAVNIYDINGKVVENLFSGFKSAGNYSIDWKANNLPSGVYFVNVNTESFTATQKITLLK